MSELRKPFEKNQMKKIKKTENQSENAVCEQKTIREELKFNSNKKLCLV